MKQTPQPRFDPYLEVKGEYVPSKKPVFIKTRTAQFLAIAGDSAPGGEDFQKRMGALFGVAYTIKFSRKAAGKADYKVCGPEGLYWEKPEGGMNWKLVIRTPDFVKKADLKAALQRLAEKDKGPEVAEVALEKIKGGRFVQMLHVGPYTGETATVARMREFAEGEGKTLAGPHHEIYISDPRRVKPEKLKTILRYAVK